MSETNGIPTLAEVDADGLIAETMDRAGFSRASFLGGAALGSAALLTAVLDAPAEAASRQGDIEILQFDLAMEYLQAALYTEAERLGALDAKTLRWARVIGAHERAHVVALKGLLGPRLAQKSGTFDFRGVTEDQSKFIKTSVAFEDLTAALLKWQAPRLSSPHILAAALSLHTVEARHAAWVRHVIGLPPASHAFDEPAPQKKMAQLIASTHFVVSQPRMRSRRAPKLTG